MPRPAAAALALCALLAAVGATLAQPTGWSCSSIPTNWGSDQENSDNPAWVDLAAQPSTEVFDKIYATYQSRYSSQPLAAWPNCEAPVPTAVGCQQNYGEGENAGTNLALQVNYTCGTTALGMTVDVNTYQSFINVDDMDVEFIAVNGNITQGNLDGNDWWESTDDLWGNFESFTPQQGSNQNNNNNENENNNNNENQNENENNQNNNNNNNNNNNQNNNN